jgi:hypothetical protein
MTSHTRDRISIVAVLLASVALSGELGGTGYAASMSAPGRTFPAWKPAPHRSLDSAATCDVRYAEASGPTQEAASALYRRGRTLFELGQDASPDSERRHQYARAEDCFRRALRVMTALFPPRGGDMVSAHNYLGRTLMASGGFADIAEAQRLFAEAEQEFRAALALADVPSQTQPIYGYVADACLKQRRLACADSFSRGAPATRKQPPAPR